MNKQELKVKFKRMLLSTNREGIEHVIKKLEELGFFMAPASTKFHLNYEGGLLEHSMNVCETALELREMMIRKKDELSEFLPQESVIIAALLHDVCKTDIYKPAIKRQNIMPQTLTTAITGWLTQLLEAEITRSCWRSTKKFSSRWCRKD